MSQIDPMLMQPSQGHGNDLQSLVHAVSVFESEHSTLTPDEERAPHSSHTLEETTDVVNGEGAEGSNTHMTRKRKAKSADQPSDTNMSQEGSEARSRKRRSKKQPATDEPTGPGDEEHFVEAGSRRGASAVPRRSRTRQPSLPPFDPEADPGVELDPTATTMAALCNDTGHGRVSSKAAQIINNHAAWRATNREKRARMKAAMEAKKYGRNPDDDESAPPATIAEVPQDNLEVDITSAAHDLSGSTPRSAPQPSSTDLLGGEGARDAGDDFDYTQNLATSRFNVQVRIGPNGETIIDEESLFVDRNEEQDTTNYTHVEESDTTKFVNSGTYSKKLRGSRWSAEETELFYDALSQFGENYELISYVLPGRDRKACKNKFKAEDKKNSARITYCLTHRRPYDMETLSRMTGKDFSGPTPEIRAPTPLRSIELDTNRQEPNIEAKRAVRKSKTSRLDDDVEVLGDLEDIEKMDVDDAAFEN
ncbi:hypothetical protein CERSUDRAFT_129101 [Gelatoporia subvermispora B]|uniref:Uncharacterized protein n=1 Tax=Ceriporiopsis subvermispora (strain B) TaxID=914234 RepID=M2RTW4_CERS8|nr:hypothetical protein CERSUDRAFT_129101 [Gelatoporia subvermispora B]